MATNSKEYMKENYKKYYGTAEAIKARVQRNAARRLMIKKGKAAKGDGKDVDHKNGLQGGNGMENLQTISRIKNRIKGQREAMKNRTHVYNTKTK